MSGEVPSPLVGSRAQGGRPRGGEQRRIAGHSLVLQRLFFHARKCGLLRVVACACPPLRGATPRQQQSRLHCPRSPATFRRSHPTQQIKHIPHTRPGMVPTLPGLFHSPRSHPSHSSPTSHSLSHLPRPLRLRPATDRRPRHAACGRLRPAMRRAGFVARARRCAPLARTPNKARSPPSVRPTRPQ